MPDDKKNTGTYKKCINCSLRLLFVPKIMLNDLNESLLEILKAWISPTTITVDDCICMECYHVLNQAVGQTDPQNKPLRGHRSVCYGCGASTLRTRTSLLKYPERSIVMEWTFPHLVNKLERVCPACRLAARRIAIKNGPLDRPIVKKTGLHDEKEMSDEPEFEIKQEFIQEFRPESPCTDTELTNECTISQTENDFTARIASQVKNTSQVFCPNSANIDTEGKNESPLNPQTENAHNTITTSEESFFNSDIDENESISRITPQQFDSNSFDSDTESENEYIDDLFTSQAENVPVVARSTSQELDSISQHSDTELKNEYIAPPIPQAESDPQVARIASQELLSNSHENVSLARIDSQEFNSNFLHSDTELKNRYRAPLIPQAENNPAVVRIKLQKFISSQNGIKMVPLTKMAAQGISASKNAIKVGPFARFTLQESNSSSQNRIKIVPVGRIPSQEFNSSSQSGIKIVAKASTQEFNSNSPYAEKNVPTARINKVYTECSSLPRTENSTVERIISSQNGIKIVPVDRIPSQEFNSSSQSGIKIVAKARTQEFNSNSPYAVNVPIARVNKVYAGCSSLPQTENSTVGRVISKRYKRVADTYNRCIFTNCAKEDCFNVPVSLKKTLLSQYKVYIPLSARMCSYHLNYGVWGDLIATNSDFTGQQMDDMMNIMQCGLTTNRLVKTSKGEQIRTSSIKLSVKVVDAAQRLRDTLIHEMCHAATWLIDGELRAGHGPVWKKWASRALRKFPELGEISRCHDMEIHYKYSYKCTKCGYSIKRHSKSIDVTKKCCGYCRGQFEIIVNRKNKDGVVVSTPARKGGPNDFALYVKENYGTLKTGRTHAQVMKMLGEQFSAKKTQKQDNVKIRNTDEIFDDLFSD